MLERKNHTYLIMLIIWQIKQSHSIECSDLSLCFKLNLWPWTDSYRSAISRYIHSNALHIIMTHVVRSSEQVSRPGRVTHRHWWFVCRPGSGVVVGFAAGRPGPCPARWLPYTPPPAKPGECQHHESPSSGTWEAYSLSTGNIFFFFFIEQLHSGIQ